MIEIQDITEAPATGQKAVLLFWAPWHEVSTEGGPMDQVLRALATVDGVLFGRVHAEECPPVTSKYNVTVVPTFVLLSSDGSVVDKIEGGEDVAKVTQAVQRLLTMGDATTAIPLTWQTPNKASISPEERLTQKLKGLINSSPVMLFMKGVPDAPKCGFSRQTVELLQSETIPFSSFNILSDEEVRQGLKTYSDWPTYPQLYVNGELIGGLDILKEMTEEGALREQLEISSDAIATPPETLNQRLEKLVRQHQVMLFMKGIPSAPRCGFSRQIVEILDGEGISYDSFDILQDEDVRQGLKTFSDWPTYPQLYVNGELMGGLDIIKEIKDDSDGGLKDALGVK